MDHEVAEMLLDKNNDSEITVFLQRLVQQDIGYVTQQCLAAYAGI